MGNAAIVLSAGKGSRMHSDIEKQYMELNGRPVLYYSLKAFEDFASIEKVIIVASKEREDYIRRKILEKYGLKKVYAIVEGGKERYDSVANGIAAAGECDYIFIHDGARPILTQSLLSDLLEAVKKDHAVVPAAPVKDTIKVCDENGVVVSTPNRSTLWAVQTPQVFDAELISEAYRRLYIQKPENITDDAMVAEATMGAKIRVVTASSANLKITTPEDLDFAEILVKKLLT